MPSFPLLPDILYVGTSEISEAEIKDMPALRKAIYIGPVGDKSIRARKVGTVQVVVFELVDPSSLISLLPVIDAIRECHLESKRSILIPVTDEMRKACKMVSFIYTGLICDASNSAIRTVMRKKYEMWGSMDDDLMDYSSTLIKKEARSLRVRLTITKLDDKLGSWLNSLANAIAKLDGSDQKPQGKAGG